MSPAGLPATGTLRGLRVLVTRPAHQAEALRQMIEARGGEAPGLPLIAIEPAYDSEAARRVLDAARDNAGWIFTSANAVTFAATLDAGKWPPLYAIGGATARALELAGHPGAVVPVAGYNSEALLELPGFHDITGRRFLIVTGENGRNALAEGLSARGAAVETLTLYRRQPLDHDAERVRAEVQVADAIVLTSGEALEQLWRLTPVELRERLLRCRLVVPSRRVLEKALALGFSAPLLPIEVADEAIVRCLEQWRAEPSAEKIMNDTPQPAVGVSTPAPPVRRSAGLRSAVYAALAWLLVIGLLAALGYTGWLLWQSRQALAASQQAQALVLGRLTRQGEELAAETAQLTARQTDQSRASQRNNAEIASLQSRFDDTEQVMGRLTEELQGGRARFELVSVEHLLLLANDRLLIERDVSAALQALEIADGRLAKMVDPRLFSVRQSLAAERAALQAVPRPDLASAALTLASLIDRAPRLPLHARVPDHFDAHPELPEFPPDLPWPQRLWSSIKEALKSVFVLRRDDNSRALRLLPVEQEAVVYQVLALKLEAARVALLRGDAAAFRDLTHSAADWLREHFKPDDPGVAAALAELERLEPLALQPTLPDITRSLTLLRAQLEAAPR